MNELQKRAVDLPAKEFRALVRDAVFWAIVMAGMILSALAVLFSAVAAALTR